MNFKNIFSYFLPSSIRIVAMHRDRTSVVAVTSMPLHYQSLSKFQSTSGIPITIQTITRPMKEGRHGRDAAWLNIKQSWERAEQFLASFGFFLQLAISFCGLRLHEPARDGIPLGYAPIMRARSQPFRRARVFQRATISMSRT